MIPEPANKFGRRRDEVPTAGELLATINKPLPQARDSEEQVLAAWMKWPSVLEDPGISPACFADDSLQTLAKELLAMQAEKRPMFCDGRFDLVLFFNHLEKAGLLDRLRGQAVDVFSLFPLPSHYTYHRQIVQETSRRRCMIRMLALAVDRLQNFGRTEGETLDGIVSDLHQHLSELETADEAAELPHRPTPQIVEEVLQKVEDQRQHPGNIPGVSTGFPRLDRLTGGLQPGRLWTVLAESSHGKSMLGRQMLEEAAAQGHAGIIYTYEMMDDEEISRMLCSQGRVSSNHLLLGTLHESETEALRRAADTVRGWDITVIDVAGRCIEDIHRDIRRRSRRLAEGQHLIAMIDYPQIARVRKRCSNREQEIAFITGETKQCAKAAVRTTIILPSQVNKEGDARESMAIEQDADVKLQILSPDPLLKRGPHTSASSNANASAHFRSRSQPLPKPWEQTSAPPPSETTPAEDLLQQMRRRLYLGKNRGGRRGDSLPVLMKGDIFRFEEER